MESTTGTPTGEEVAGAEVVVDEVVAVAVAVEVVGNTTRTSAWSIHSPKYCRQLLRQRAVTQFATTAHGVLCKQVVCL